MSAAHCSPWPELIVIGTACALAGCVTRDPYPDYWPAMVAVPASACTDIAGRYRNEAIQTGECYAGDTAYKAEWDCDLRLNWALGEPAVATTEQWVEIRQPDPDRIEVVTNAEVRVLRRSAGDFDCDARGIVVSQHASAASEEGESKAANAYMTSMLAMLATGGVQTLSLHFRKAADGSLVAELVESMSGLTLAIPTHRSERHYLRWATWVDATPPTVPVEDPPDPEALR
jgi:hypothetical protein